MKNAVGASSSRHSHFDGPTEATMTTATLESPPPIIASSSRTTTNSNSRQASLSPQSSRQPTISPFQPMHNPILMEMSTSTSTSSIESSPSFHQPSRFLFHDTPTAPSQQQQPQVGAAELVSPTPSHVLHGGEVHTETSHNDQDVFGKIDHTPLRQDTHSTSPLPNSRSLQMGDMLDHVLDAEQFSSLSVGNIIAPERNSSKKPPKRLPTDPGSTTASPTPLSRSSARARTALTSIAVNKSTDAAMSSSPVSDPLRATLVCTCRGALDARQTPHGSFARESTDALMDKQDFVSIRGVVTTNCQLIFRRHSSIQGSNPLHD